MTRSYEQEGVGKRLKLKKLPPAIVVEGDEVRDIGALINSKSEQTRKSQCKGRYMLEDGTYSNINKNKFPPQNI